MAEKPLVPSLEDRLLSVDEVAKIFSVSKFTVRLWCRDGKMEGHKMPNGTWRVPHSAMVKYANQLYGSPNE